MNTDKKIMNEFKHFDDKQYAKICTSKPDKSEKKVLRVHTICETKRPVTAVHAKYLVECFRNKGVRFNLIRLKKPTWHVKVSVVHWALNVVRSDGEYNYLNAYLTIIS